MSIFVVYLDADHVSVWSKGGATTIENCQMLCKTHNRVKVTMFAFANEYVLALN